MPALIQFVDSISATPTVRLDVNDAVSWFCRNFSAPPPRLRRSVANNAMRDGVHVGSSTYDARTLELELTLIEDLDDEFAAEEMQKLWRELDRPDNVLRYWPEGLDKPVFFRLYRSDVSSLEELWTVPLARTITLELLAEPFALGLKESLGPYTVSNNLAAASNGCYFDVSTVVGDVAAPMVMWHDNADQTTRDLVAVTPSPLFTWAHAEGGSPVALGTDTTNPGGGPDADMSGTGTNNYVRTSFATTLTMAERVRWDVPAITPSGRYRVLAWVRLPNNSAVRSVQLWAPGADGVMVAQSPVLSWPTTGVFPKRIMVDFGLIAVGDSDAGPVGYGSATPSRSPYSLSFRGASSAAQALDWDAFALVPAGDATSTALVDYPTTSTANGLVLDGVRGEALFQVTAGDPTVGAGAVDLTRSPKVAGTFPTLTPGVTNRCHLFRTVGGDLSSVSTSCTVSAAYWPRYLFIRPVSS